MYPSVVIGVLFIGGIALIDITKCVHWRVPVGTLVVTTVCSINEAHRRALRYMKSKFCKKQNNEKNEMKYVFICYLY